MAGQRTTQEPHGIDVVPGLLERMAVPYEVIEHTEEGTRDAFPALDVARSRCSPRTPAGGMDIALLLHERVGCAGGEHERSVRIAPPELLRLAEPRVADIREDPDDREQPGNRPSF
jgi:hypothetical protein